MRHNLSRIRSKIIKGVIKYIIHLTGYSFINNKTNNNSVLRKMFKSKCPVQHGTVYVVSTVVFLCPRLFLLLVKVEKKISAAL